MAENDLKTNHRMQFFATSALDFGKGINVIRDRLGIDKFDIKIVATKEDYLKLI